MRWCWINFHYYGRQAKFEFYDRLLLHTFPGLRRACQSVGQFWEIFGLTGVGCLTMGDKKNSERLFLESLDDLGLYRRCGKRTCIEPDNAECDGF